MDVNIADQQQTRSILDGFEERFKENDIDGFIDYFAEDAVYVEYNGRVNKGKNEIRKAFEPLFRGDFGKISFEDEDYFENEEGNKVTITWWCVHEFNGKTLRFRGLDVYRIENGLIKDKRAYVQTYTYCLKYFPLKVFLQLSFVFYFLKRKLANFIPA